MSDLGRGRGATGSSKGKSQLGACILAAAVLLMPVAFAAAQSSLTPDAAKQQIAERFGVDVLRVAEGEHDGQKVYILTVMNPGGDSNGAFQVTRLMVDRATGELVSQFRHDAAGYELPGGEGVDVTGGADGRAIRRMTHSGSPGQPGQ